MNLPSRTRNLLLAALAAVGFTGAFAWWDSSRGDRPATRVPGPPHLLLVTLGGERPDLPPLLEGLDDALLRFPVANAVTNWPSASAVVAHSGVVPPSLGKGPWGLAPVPSDSPTLAEAMRAGGYRPTALLGDPLLLEVDGLARGFESFEPGTVDGPGSLAQDRARIERAREVLERAAPQFLWLHLSGASAPYPGHGASLEGWLRDSRSRDRSEVAAALREVHAATQAAHRSLLEGLIRDLLRGEASRPVRGVVTALCGHELLDEGLIGVGTTLGEEGLAIPWILLGQDLPVGRVGRRVSHVDLAPTLLELAGLPPERSHQGLCVLPDHPAPARILHAFTRRLVPGDVVYEEQLKLIRRPDHAPDRLFDLSTPGGEQLDLQSVRPLDARRLAQRLDEVLGR